MKRILMLVAISVFVCATASAFQGGGGEPTKKGPNKKKEATQKKTSAASPAKPGFYIQFDMCHACAFADWQKYTASALSRAAVSALVSDDVSSHYTEQGYWTLSSIRLRGIRNEGWPTPLYGGPFESESGARQVFSRLPAILTPVFDQIDRERAAIGDTDYKKYFSRRFENCTGNQCDIYGFFVQLVRVSG